MTTLKLALDWTPNVNHLGFLIARDLGFYHEHGIDLDIINPADDNYAVTPGKKLELDLADFAIAPFETVISLNNKANKVNALAVYAILQSDLSCIVTLRTSGISSPKQLDGKTYASYKARYEDHIVKEMIRNDGGQGDINIIYPEKLGIWNTLLSGKADSTWIFDNWEGVETDSKQIELNRFGLSAFKIPYGYSPVVITKRENLAQHKSLYANFIKASRKGYLFIEKNLDESVRILKRYASRYDLENIDMEKAVKISLPHFGSSSDCGVMQQDRIAGFLEWLATSGLEDKAILHQSLFTNELFD